jgi:hypothetical protein
VQFLERMPSNRIFVSKNLALLVEKMLRYRNILEDDK